MIVRIRRWFATALVLAGLTICGAAFAGQTVALDDIGLRYAAGDGEALATREGADARVLTALGVDADTLHGAMIRDGLYLISILPDGWQFSLGVDEKPAGLACVNQAEMNAADKEVFLQQLARRGGYGSAAWKQDGYALFSSSAEAQNGGALSYADLSLSTLYLDQVLTFRTELIGREAAQTDTDLLVAAAERTLRLGAKTQPAAEETEPQTLTLPAVEVPSAPAAFTYGAQTCDLTLDPVAGTIGVTRFTLSGVTLPGAYLRYAVNGKTSSRITADDAGAFSVTVPNLNGDEQNAIRLTVYKGDQKTVVDFTVTVDWQLSPLVLETVGDIAQDEVTLRGLTLPGATVKLTAGRGVGRITVGEDGAFTVTLRLTHLGENEFTLQAQAAGYHRNDVTLSVTRVESAADTIDRLQRLARSVPYEKLLARPAAYADRVVELGGTASKLRYQDGAPSFVLTTDSGDGYAVRCDNLLAVTQGMAIRLLGTLSGAVSGDRYPEVTLGAILP